MTYNEVGLTPEFTVEYDAGYETELTNYANTSDPQLRKAVEVISTKVAVAAAESASAEETQAQQ